MTVVLHCQLLIDQKQFCTGKIWAKNTYGHLPLKVPNVNLTSMCSNVFEGQVRLGLGRSHLYTIIRTHRRLVLTYQCIKSKTIHRSRIPHQVLTYQCINVENHISKYNSTFSTFHDICLLSKKNLTFFRCQFYFFKIETFHKYLISKKLTFEKGFCEVHLIFYFFFAFSFAIQKMLLISSQRKRE